MQVMDDICPGMLLGESQEDKLINLGMIIDVMDDEDEAIRTVTVVGTDFLERNYHSLAKEPSSYFVFDKIM